MLIWRPIFVGLLGHLLILPTSIGFGVVKVGTSGPRIARFANALSSAAVMMNNVAGQAREIQDKRQRRALIGFASVPEEALRRPGGESAWRSLPAAASGASPVAFPRRRSALLDKQNLSTLLGEQLLALRRVSRAAARSVRSVSWSSAPGLALTCAGEFMAAGWRPSESSRLSLLEHALDTLPVVTQDLDMFATPKLNWKTYLHRRTSCEKHEYSTSDDEEP